MHTDRNDLALLVMDHVGPDQPDVRALSIALMTPRSRGHLQVQDDGMVLLEPNLLDDPLDVERLRSGVRTVLRAVEDPELRRLAQPLGRPGDSDDEIDAWMFATTADWFHATGTCRMGPREDPMTVVDHSLRVHTVVGLFVVDASVLPTVTSCTTDVAVSAVAEHWVAAGHLYRDARFFRQA